MSRYRELADTAKRASAGTWVAEVRAQHAYTSTRHNIGGQPIAQCRCGYQVVSPEGLHYMHVTAALEPHIDECIATASRSGVPEMAAALREADARIEELEGAAQAVLDEHHRVDVAVDIDAAAEAESDFLGALDVLDGCLARALVGSIPEPETKGGGQ